MSENLIRALTASKIYSDYERAFCQTTGMPLAFRSVESWQLQHHGQPNENPFCAQLARASHACAACLQVQQQLAETATQAPQTVNCMVGLCETAVPVRLGNQLIGFLTTGQVFLKKPSEAQFKRAAQLVAGWGVSIPADTLHNLYFATRMLSAGELASIVQLLSIFAQHLALVSNQIIMQDQNHELPLIARAKHFIHANYGDKLTLGQVAQAVNASSFYFCKMFSKATGIHFTDYLCRVRIERAKILLINPNLRVSEIAFEIGFQSLTHFNRVFKRILGRSPTDYRKQLARG